MKSEIRAIRKEIKLSLKELKQIEQQMESEKEFNFSEFTRKRLLKNNMGTEETERIILLSLRTLQLNKLSNIEQEIQQARVLAESVQSVNEEHIRIILNCVQELISEVAASIPISQIFKEKYFLK